MRELNEDPTLSDYNRANFSPVFARLVGEKTPYEIKPSIINLTTGITTLNDDEISFLSKIPNLQLAAPWVTELDLSRLPNVVWFYSQRMQIPQKTLGKLPHQELSLYDMHTGDSVQVIRSGKLTGKYEYSFGTVVNKDRVPTKNREMTDEEREVHGRRAMYILLIMLATIVGARMVLYNDGAQYRKINQIVSSEGVELKGREAVSTYLRQAFKNEDALKSALMKAPIVLDIDDDRFTVRLDEKGRTIISQTHYDYSKE